jgi:hypothetical protein
VSLKPDPTQPVPETTARVAKAAFRKGNPLLSLRDELAAWLQVVPRAATCTSRFAALAA